MPLYCRYCYEQVVVADFLNHLELHHTPIYINLMKSITNQLTMNREPAEIEQLKENLKQWSHQS